MGLTLEAVLHGRRRECAAIDALLDSARASHGGSLVVRGESGVGKSVLLAHAVDQAPDLHVLAAVGVPAESGLPFSSLQRLVRPVLGHLDALPVVQATALREALGLLSAQRPDRFLIALAVLSLLAEAGTERGVLCVLDDAQWLDPETLDALLFVCRRVEAERIALLFAETDGLGARCVPREMPQLFVSGLDRLASDAMLVERTGGTTAPEVRATLWDSTRGNPLALTELVSVMTPAELEGRVALPASLRLGLALQHTLSARAARLPRATQALLLIAAAEGGGDIGLVLRAAAAVGIGPESLDPAEEGGIVRVDAAGITFRHPLMRTAIYQAAPFGRRQAAHRVLADSLPDSEADRRAWHRSAAAVSPDDRVAGELVALAQRAGPRGGHAAASMALERAADLTSEHGSAGRRLTAAAESAWMAGRGPRARGLLDRAAALTSEPVDLADIERLRGLVEAEWGDRRAGYDFLVTGAGRVTVLDPARAARMLVEAARIAWQDADLAGLAQTGRRLQALDLPDGAAENQPARIMAGIALVARGDLDAGTPLLSDTGADSDDPLRLHIAASAAIATGDDVTARTLLIRAIDQARSRGAASRLPQILASITSLEAFGGEFTAATVHAAEGIDLARETGQEHVQAHLTAVLAWIAAIQGREADCATLAAEAQRLARGHGIRPPITIATWALAVSDLGAGRWPSALTRLESLTTPNAPEFHPTLSLLAAADLAEAAARLGRTQVTGPTMARLADVAGRTSSSWVRALYGRCRALLSDPTAASAWFEEALGRHAEASRRFDEARTHLLYGEFLRRSQRRTDARVHLRLAVEVFDQLGAAPWEARARAELRATGESIRKREPDALARLTPQQREIVRLVAAGETNKQIAARLFVSPRTIDYHLRNVFTQLDITSRTELIRLSEVQAQTGGDGRQSPEEPVGRSRPPSASAGKPGLREAAGGGRRGGEPEGGRRPPRPVR